MACSKEVAHAKDVFQAAEEEMLKASEAMAGPRPIGIAAALEEVAAKLTGVPGGHQQHCLGLLLQLL
eukprot:9040349-Lingulodinium_polyedra.AAC.1